MMIPDRKESSRAIDGHWLPSLIVGIYFMSVWKPSVFQVERQRWYVAAGLAVLAFCLHYLTGRGRGSLRATKIFWIICGTSLLGAVISLFRAADTDETTRRTVTLALNYGLLSLFVPVLTTALARRVLLMTLIVAAGLWSFEIHRLLGAYGELYYRTFGETGANKNLIGFCLVLAGISLFYLAIFWRPARRSLLAAGVRWSAIAAGVYLWYNVGLIYARSGILAAIMGAIAMQVAGVIKSRKKAPAVLWVGLGVSVTAFLLTLILPMVSERAPQWSVMYAELQASGSEAIFYNRELLLRKGLHLIRENPLVGIGAGGSLEAVSSPGIYFPRYTIHNTYLTDWAEYGILGLLSNVLWVVIYVKGVKRRFRDATLCDQAWLLLFVPLFFQMTFMEMSTISYTMLAILAGISGVPKPVAVGPAPTIAPPRGANTSRAGAGRRTLTHA